MPPDLRVPVERILDVRLEADFAEETATEYRWHVYEHEGVVVILLECIYLPRAAFRQHNDLSIGIECGFETARERAVA